MALFGRKKNSDLEDGGAETARGAVSEERVKDSTIASAGATKKIKKEKKAGAEAPVLNPFLEKIPTPPNVDDMVEGPVISIDKGAVYIDLPPFGTGIIYGKEFQNARDIIKR